MRKFLILVLGDGWFRLVVRYGKWRYPGEHLFLDENDAIVAHGKDGEKTANEYRAAHPGEGGYLFHIDPHKKPHPEYVSRPRGRSRS